MSMQARSVVFFLLGVTLTLTFVRLKPQWIIPNTLQKLSAQEPEENSLDEDSLIDLLKRQQEQMDRDLNNFFDEDFFGQKDPFDSLRRFREKLGVPPLGGGRSQSNSFDSWFGRRFGGGSVFDITKREDDRFVYYDVQVDDVESTNLETKIDQGHITIIGETKKQDHAGSQGGSFFSSRFSRSFPLPAEADGENMEVVREKNRIILKFPKKTTTL